MRIRIASLAVILGLALVAVVQAPAVAKPYESGTYEYHDTFSFRDCGLRLHGDDSGYGRFAIREIRGSEGEAYLAHDNYWYTLVVTNKDNGKWMVVRGHALFREMTGTQIDGDIWEFTARESGQPTIVEDMTGAVVMRDRGMIEFRGVFDVLGDGQPSGELIEEEILHIAGPHPLFEGGLCGIVNELIG